MMALRGLARLNASSYRFLGLVLGYYAFIVTVGLIASALFVYAFQGFVSNDVVHLSGSAVRFLKELR
jgi:hypothetical protein